MHRSVSAAAPKLTFQEYRFYQSEGDGLYELFRGQLIPMPTPTAIHTSICQFLMYQLQQYSVAHSLDLVAINTVAVRTEEDSARIPDVLVCSQSLWREIQARPGAGVLDFGETPQLVVEVTSENWREDYIRKSGEYALIDIPEYWIVDPNQQQICVCSNPANQYGYERQEFKPGEVLKSPQFPDLALAVNQILSPPIVEDLIRQERERQQEELKLERQRAERLATKLRELNIDPDSV